ncbi:MAG: SGNH/GDSL hydrolase family protein, partial [Bacteroidota bacterium]
ISNKVVRDEIIPLIDEVVKDAKVELIDLYRPFNQKENLFPDGVHPNAAGAAQMAEHIAKYLENNPEPK